MTSASVSSELQVRWRLPSRTPYPPPTPAVLPPSAALTVRSPNLVTGAIRSSCVSSILVFSGTGIGLRQGRLFDASDVAGGGLVAVVNQTLANHYFAGESILGKLVDGVGSPWKEVVGVVADTRNDGLTSLTRPEIYLPLIERWKVEGGGVTHSYGLNVVIRTGADTAPTIAALRGHLREMDRSLVTSTATMGEQWEALGKGPDSTQSCLAALLFSRWRWPRPVPTEFCLTF